MNDRVRPSLGRLLSRSLSVLASNGIILYGVAVFGWNRAGIVLLFVLEGVIVFLLDIVRSRASRDSQAFRSHIFIEGAFILFFGFFALLVFGPYESLEAAIGDGFRAIFRLAVEVRFAVFGILFFRLVQLGQDLVAAGIFGGPAKRPLLPQGGGWMLLLFFAVMLAPLIARTGPNPTGGLIALVSLKTLGELLAVWADRLFTSARARVRG
ncbi:MAG: DUF6498-containing protein [Candidatus Aminicenantes bacterium]|nr:DUF6498-containing protein [Candidatus Aminicenantes bacterium]